MQLHAPLLEVTPTDSAEWRAAWESSTNAVLEPNPRRGFDSFPEEGLVLLTCRDERHQVELLERFHAEGLEVKALLS